MATDRAYTTARVTVTVEWDGCTTEVANRTLPDGRPYVDGRDVVDLLDDTHDRAVAALLARMPEALTTRLGGAS